MTALEFANGRENVVVRFASNGCPAGQDVAWIPPETQLPFDLDEIEGEVDEAREFTTTNLNDGSGLRGWRFYDWNGNLVHSISLREDEVVWQRQYEDLMAEG